MKDNKKSVILIVAIIAVLLVMGIVAITMLNQNDKDDVLEDDYRIIKVYEVEGDALVNRASIGTVEAYANMVLESGDTVTLNSGKMTLKLDEDKYIYLEEGTVLELLASGTASNSKTTVNLKQGAVTNEIQNKLSEESSYELNTPNSTMAVRGTIYRAEIYKDDQGTVYTKVSVFNGAVKTCLKKDDGTVDKPVDVDNGKEVTIYQDTKTTDYVSGAADINYEELPTSVLELLQKIQEDGADIGIEPEELDELIHGPTEVTVTFMYNGMVFGTQVMMSGECAKRPSLAPAPSGDWDFDFSQPIEEDTTIEWK